MTLYPIEWMILGTGVLFIAIATYLAFWITKKKSSYFMCGVVWTCILYVMFSVFSGALAR